MIKTYPVLLITWTHQFNSRCILVGALYLDKLKMKQRAHFEVNEGSAKC